MLHKKMKALILPKKESDDQGLSSQIQSVAVPHLAEELRRIYSIVNPLGYFNLSFLSKGKRGYVFLANYKGKRVCIKSRNPKSAIDTLYNEFSFLKRLKEYNIAPKPIESHSAFISMEYIKGLVLEDFITTLSSGKSNLKKTNATDKSLKSNQTKNEEKYTKTYLKTHAKTKIILLLWELIDQMLLLDSLGINKLEMTHPTKHIIVKTEKSNSKKNDWIFKPLLIDFERARFSKNPKNLTQFISYITSKKMIGLLEGSGLKINKDALIKLVKKYKDFAKSFTESETNSKTFAKSNSFSFHNPIEPIGSISSNLKKGKTPKSPLENEEISLMLKKQIWLRPSSFSEKVLSETLLIPKGKVVSYSYIAKRLKTRAFQAVGIALSKNPFAPIVPCHRVICSNGFLGGFNGGYEKSKIKENLLKSEGIETYKIGAKTFIPKRYFLN